MARSILFVALPRALEKAIGSHASASLLLRVFSRSAYDGFREFMGRLSIERMTLPETLAVFTERFPVEHPFRVFTGMEQEGERTKLVFRDSICRDIDLVSMSTIVGAIEGVLRAIGIEVRAVLSETGMRALCSRGSGDRQILVIRPVIRNVAPEKRVCEVLIEKLSCD